MGGWGDDSIHVNCLSSKQEDLHSIQESVFNIKNKKPGWLEKWLRALALTERTQAQLLAPKGWFTTICNSNSRASGSLF